MRGVRSIAHASGGGIFWAAEDATRSSSDLQPSPQ